MCMSGWDPDGVTFPTPGFLNKIITKERLIKYVPGKRRKT